MENNKEVIDIGGKHSFDKEGYVLLPGYLNERERKLIINYFNFKQKKKVFFANNSLMLFKYADTLAESLLVQLQPQIELIVGKALFPHYSISAIYRRNSTLPKHSDSPECEVSATLCIDFQSDEIWPIYLQKGDKTIEIAMDKGDILIFAGNRHEHWREQFQGTSQIQIFLFYMYQDSVHVARKYDGRKSVGMPRSGSQKLNSYLKFITRYTKTKLLKSKF